MSNTYYDSQLTAAEIEAALEAIDGVITPANNGKVLAIENGGIVAKDVSEYTDLPVLVSKSISANGNYNPASDNADGYSSVAVNVPNSYAAGDEGKVVSNGALVAQTARSSDITQNGTYDTTLNDEVTVNVSGGGSATLITKNITQNGTYNASSDNADGYSQVTVNVSGGSPVEPALPSEYQRVEYLDFTPSIGIYITLPTTGKILFTATFSADDVTGSRDAFGYRVSSSNDKDFEVGVYNGTIHAFIRNPGNATGIIITNGDAYTQGEIASASTLLVNPRSTALIGKYAAYSSSGVDGMTFDGKIYSLTGDDIVTGERVAWFVPCYRKSDNKVGFYDHVAQAFYSNTYAVGSGYSIVAGPDVN